MKKTEQQKELEGTNRKDRTAGESSVDILQKVATPKSFFNLSADAKKWYRYLGGMLLQTKRLTNLDTPNLVLLAQAWSEWAAAMQKINELNDAEALSGLVQTFKNGASNVTGYYTVKRNAEDSIVKVSKLFGMNFKDRHSIASFFEENTNQLDLFGSQQQAHPDNNPHLKVIGGQ